MPNPGTQPIKTASPMNGSAWTAVKSPLRNSTRQSNRARLSYGMDQLVFLSFQSLRGGVFRCLMLVLRLRRVDLLSLLGAVILRLVIPFPCLALFDFSFTVPVDNG